MNRAPSLTALLAAFPSVDFDKLRLIRTVWRGSASEMHDIAEAHAPSVLEWKRACHHPPLQREVRRRVVDVLLGTHGVEHLGTHRRTGKNVFYCNSGDTYATTLIFHGSNMYIGCWGDLVEGSKIREAQ